MLKLQVQERNKGTGSDTLRKAGDMPAVFYGRKEPSTSISMSQKAFREIWKKAGESSVITLDYMATGTTDKPKKSLSVLIHDVAVDPVKGMPLHADFYVVEADRKLEVEVELEFVGVSAAVKDLGGTLLKALHEITVEAFPQDLPQHLEVDISALATLDDKILVSDLKMPPGVTAITDGEETVAAITVTQDEPEEAVVFDADAVEVVAAKGKKEEEEIPDSE